MNCNDFATVVSEETLIVGGEQGGRTESTATPRASTSQNAEDHCGWWVGLISAEIQVTRGSGVPSPCRL